MPATGLSTITWLITLAYCVRAARYCHNETFQGNCPSGEFIIMIQAKYGHMSPGRCMTADDDHVGGGSDVIDWVDQRCSGKRSCKFNELELFTSKCDTDALCLNDNDTYLEADYKCIKAEDLACQMCTAHISNTSRAHVSSQNGYIASWITQNQIQDCGSTTCPWLIEAPTGQTISITIYDFSNKSRPVALTENCVSSGFIVDTVTREQVLICAGNDRIRHLYTSLGNSLEIIISDAFVFILQYEAVNQYVRILGDGNYSVSKSGYAQMYLQDRWYSLCDHGWSDNDARVFCNQLGYDRGIPFFTSYILPTNPTEPIWNAEIACSEADTNVMQCLAKRMPSNCEPAFVSCDRVDFRLANGTLRLTNGPTAYSGIVEVAYRGLWGSICDRSWDETTAGVMCSILDYHEGGMPVTHSAFGITHDVFVDDVRCSNGDETNITQCMRRPFMEQYCKPTRTAGVVCLQEKYSNLTGQVRLTNGQGSHEGYIEVSFYGIWGTICSDEWSDSETRVVCRQLGYETGGISRTRFTHVRSPSWLRYIYCEGNESSLTECNLPSWKHIACSAEHNVKIQCYNQSTGLELGALVYGVAAAVTVLIIVLVSTVVIIHKRKIASKTNDMPQKRVCSISTRNPVYHPDLSFSQQKRDDYQPPRCISGQYDYIDDTKNAAYLDIIGEDDDKCMDCSRMKPRINIPLPMIPGHDNTQDIQSVVGNQEQKSIADIDDDGYLHAIGVIGQSVPYYTECAPLNSNKGKLVDQNGSNCETGELEAGYHPYVNGRLEADCICATDKHYEMCTAHNQEKMESSENKKNEALMPASCVF